jgi:hypothetical protein
MDLSAKQMTENYEHLMVKVQSLFTGSRQEALVKLYTDWGPRIATAPASGKKSFHNGFAGGYVLHVLNVLEVAPQVMNMWTLLAGELDFTSEELMFVALNHDLGKIGTELHDYYIPCQEEWMLRKGQTYVLNPKLQYMKVSDRSLMTLSNRGIYMSDKEYLGIKLHDGLYEESNKAYFMSYNEDYELKTSLPHIMHIADITAAKCESLISKKGNRPSGKATDISKAVSQTPVKTKSNAVNRFLNE